MKNNIKELVNVLTFKNVFKLFLIIFILSIPFKNAVYQVSLVILILMFFLHMIVNKNYQQIKNLYYNFKSIFYLFGLLIISLTISNLLNIDLENNSLRALLSFFYKFGLLFWAFLYFYMIGFFKEKEIIYYVFFSILLQFFIGTHQAIFYHNVLESINNISDGITGATFNRNQFGLIMGIAVLISILYFKNKFIIYITPLFISGVVFSYSRAVWIALICAIILYGVLNLKKFSLKDISIVLVIFTISIIIFFSIDSVSSRFEQLLNGHSSGRFEIWIHSIDLIKEQLFFGYGLDAWNNFKFKTYSNIHNSLLEILFVSGIVGLIILLSILILIVKEVLVTQNYKILSILLYFCIISFFGNSMFYSKIFLSYLIIFCVILFKNRIYNQILKEQ